MKSDTVCHALFVLLLSSASVRSDYPPPSEDTHGYYAQRRGSTAGALVGTGRTTASFGGGRYVGGASSSDWRSHSGVSDWMAPGSDSHHHGLLLGGLSQAARCVDIPDNLTLCRDIGYEQMRLPNLLEHETLREVGQQASSWVRLVAISCHPDTQVFLCSLFAPVCLDRPVWPCRSLCEAVKAGCVDHMLKYGFPWPEMLRCDQFPSDNDLCIGLRTAHTHGDEVSCAACVQQRSYDNIIDNFCTADFALRIRVHQAIVSGNELKIVTNRRRKIYKSSPAVRRRDLRGSPLYIDNGANCDCASLEQTQHLDGSSSSGSQRGDSFLVTGRRRGDRLIVELIQPFSRRSRDLRRAVRAMRQADVCEGQSVVVDVGRSRVETGRTRQRQRPRKLRGDAVTMETTTTTSSTTTTPSTTTTETGRRAGGRRSRNRQSGSRRNRGRNREARQRARTSRRDERERQGRQ